MTSRAGYEWPSDVDAVVGGLEAMARSLPQALAQAADWLDQAHDADRIGTDQGGSAEQTVLSAVQYLEMAGESASDLLAHLTSARGDTHHLTGQDARPRPRLVR